MTKIFEIHISESGSSPMQRIDSAELEAGRGIVGDRYYNELGTFSKKLAGKPDKEITLIEAEEVDTFNRQHNFEFSYGDFRRNIVTQGVRLNDLVDKEFMLGGVRLRGIRLCEPCAHLAGLLVPDIIPALVHKAGLRAQIVESGLINVGDVVEYLE